MRKTLSCFAMVSALSLGLFGCGGDEGGGGGDVDPGAWSYPETQMVMNALLLPLTSQEAKEYGFDLDHNGTIDNRLGDILVAVKGSMGSQTPQEAVDEAMGKGDIIILFSVYAENMQESKKANFWAFLGNSVKIDPPNGPQAGDTFTVDTVRGPTDAYFGGKIKGGGGVFGGDNATLVLNLPMTRGGSLELALQAVNIEFDVSPNCAPGNCEFTNGRLGGAISEQDLNTKVIPEIANLLQDQIAEDCTNSSGSCVCESGSGGATIQSMFDTDGSCTVTVEEVQNNNLLKAFLKGDVTLKDGSKGLSLAVGFEAVNAVFTHPAPPTQ